MLIDEYLESESSIRIKWALTNVTLIPVALEDDIANYRTELRQVGKKFQTGRVYIPNHDKFVSFQWYVNIGQQLPMNITEELKKSERTCLMDFGALLILIQCDIIFIYLDKDGMIMR